MTNDNGLSRPAVPPPPMNLQAQALETLRTSRDVKTLTAARILVALYDMWPTEYFEVTTAPADSLYVAHPHHLDYAALTRTVDVYLPAGLNVIYRRWEHKTPASDGTIPIPDHLRVVPEFHGHPTPPPSGAKAVKQRLENVARVHKWLGLETDAMPAAAYAAMAARIDEFEARHTERTLLQQTLRDLKDALASIQIRYEGKTAQEWAAAAERWRTELDEALAHCMKITTQNCHPLDLQGKAFTQLTKEKGWLDNPDIQVHEDLARCGLGLMALCGIAEEVRNGKPLPDYQVTVGIPTMLGVAGNYSREFLIKMGRTFLIATEVAEAIEAGFRRPAAVNSFTQNGKPEGWGVELADVLIRTLGLLHEYGCDADALVAQKHVYNATRPQRHGGKLA